MSIVSGTVGAIMGSQATTSAAETSADVQREATAQQKAIYEAEVERMKPFYEAGKAELPAFQKMLTGGYDMKESPAAQWELEKGTKAMNRALASRGLSGGGVAVNRLTELNKSIAASDWNAQYSRILDALKLGTGASGSMGPAGIAFGNQTQQGATNLANIFTQAGENKASLYSGLGGASANTAATAINAYNAYNAVPSAATAAPQAAPLAWT